MKKTLPFLNSDVQGDGSQYLEDLATGYWFSEVLFTAVELGIFSLIEPRGASAEELSGMLGLDLHGLKRFLRALIAMELILEDNQTYFNTKLASDYLISGKEYYQGDSILWRKYLYLSWKGMADCLKEGGRVDYTGSDNPSERIERIRKYIRAMDSVAKIKGRDILRFFEARPVEGEILDAGAGSGAIAVAFLERFPRTNATLLDLPDVLDCAREIIRDKGFDGRMQYCPANLLEPWPVRKRCFDLIILSNILHAYSEEELPGILLSASQCLRKKGVLLIHDFFSEHCPEKAALSDLNMFINTFNGRVFSVKSVQNELHRLGLSSTDLIPLETDTAVLFASKDKSGLGSLDGGDGMSILVSRIRAMGFRGVYRIKTEDIHITDWIVLRCQFGCDRYGDHHCPPNSPTAGETRDVLRDYRHAVLIEGEPPTRGFQLKVLEAEREAFRAGFYKAFAYWAGPCSLCSSCRKDGRCRNVKDARPSMEGAGMNVFETARLAGAALRTLRNKNDFVKYFAVILLE